MLSKSDGFPNSVVEDTVYGLIPRISEGCYFTEVFEKNLGYKGSIKGRKGKQRGRQEAEQEKTEKKKKSETIRRGEVKKGR